MLTAATASSDAAIIDAGIVDASRGEVVSFEIEMKPLMTL
jgi:hypothetical protein